MHLKIKTQESYIVALEKDKKVKDGIIKNLNDGFNEKINNLNAKIEHLEDINREVTKKEKKTLKKLRQKTQKQKADNTNVNQAEESFKDDNENILNRNDSSLDNSLQLFTPVRMKIGSPLRRAPCTPSTPLTSYTPPGLPTCFASKSESPTATLSTYFENTGHDNNFDPKPFDVKEYIQSISKITLLPKYRSKEAN